VQRFDEIVHRLGDVERYPVHGAALSVVLCELLAATAFQAKGSASA
jgi:hypothetical protein